MADDATKLTIVEATSPREHEGTIELFPVNAFNMAHAYGAVGSDWPRPDILYPDNERETP